MLWTQRSISNLPYGPCDLPPAWTISTIMRAIPKSTSDWLVKKIQNREQNFIIWNSYIHNSITSPHSCHPHLCICRTVTLVFVVPRQRTVPPTVFLKGQTCYCRVLPIILTQFVSSWARYVTEKSHPNSYTICQSMDQTCYRTVPPKLLHNLFMGQTGHCSPTQILIQCTWMHQHLAAWWTTYACTSENHTCLYARSFLN
jgi:hypothetical protein